MYLIFLSSSCPPPISPPIDTIMILLFMSLFLFSLVLAKYPLSPFPAYSQFFSLNCFLTLSISPFHCLLLPLFFSFTRLLTTHGNCSHALHLCLFLPPVQALCSGLFLCLSTCICLSVSTFGTQSFNFLSLATSSPLGSVAQVT